MNPSDVVKFDDDGWEMAPAEFFLNSYTSSSAKKPRISTQGFDYFSSASSIDIEVDENGWQVLPSYILAAPAPGAKDTKKPTPTTSSSSSRGSVWPIFQLPKTSATVSSNGLLGNKVNNVRREFWVTPAPPSSSTPSFDTSLSTQPVSRPARAKPNVTVPSRPLTAIEPYQTPPTISVVDPSWELIDPNPDIHALFLLYNATYFRNQLGSVTVDWSSKMTTCAGTCYYKSVGRFSEIQIKLSLPLLKLRPRKDLVETLLHEMIHAYLFLHPGPQGVNHDRDGHGPNFQEHMHRINRASGANITIYHSFHDEVNHYKQHWWQCNGPCRHRHPFYGLVKRAMNRAPGPADRWWSDHGANCNGVFIKIKEPVKTTEAQSNQNKRPVETNSNFRQLPSS